MKCPFRIKNPFLDLTVGDVIADKLGCVLLDPEQRFESESRFVEGLRFNGDTDDDVKIENFREGETVDSSAPCSRPSPIGARFELVANAHLWKSNGHGGL